MKEDIYNFKKSFSELYKELEEKTLYIYPENNELIKIYIDAKIKGNYKQIIYDVNKPEYTCLSNLQKYKVLEKFFNKPFKDLTQEDIDKLQHALNNNIFLTNTKVKKEQKPISRAYKIDMISHIKQFWKFYRLYAETELNKEVKNITEYLRLRNEKNNEDFDYITFPELLELIKHTKNQQQRTLLYFAFDTGSRPIELLNVQRKHFTYNDQDKIWTCKLPNMKGKSNNKIRIDLLISSEQINKYFLQNDFKPDDYIFQYTYNYLRKLFRKLSDKLGKKITPKTFRKSSTMYLIQQETPEQYLKARQGWIQDTKILKHYITHSGLKTPENLKIKIKKDVYSDYETEQALMKSEIEKMKNQLNEQIKELANTKDFLETQIKEVKKLDENKKTEQIFKQLYNISKKIDKPKKT